MTDEIHLRQKLQFPQFMQLVILVPVALFSFIVSAFFARDWVVASLVIVMFVGVLWTLSREVGQKVSLTDDGLIYRPPGFGIFGKPGWQDEARVAFEDIADARLIRDKADYLKHRLRIVDGLILTSPDGEIKIVKDAMHKDDFDMLCEAISKNCGYNFDQV